MFQRFQKSHIFEISKIQKFKKSKILFTIHFKNRFIVVPKTISLIFEDWNLFANTFLIKFKNSKFQYFWILKNSKIQKIRQLSSNAIPHPSIALANRYPQRCPGQRLTCVPTKGETSHRLHIGPGTLGIPRKTYFYLFFEIFRVFLIKY